MASFGYKTLALAVGSMGLASTAYSAGLDRSGQDVTAFLQDGTYGEVVYTYIAPSVSGKDASGNTVGDMSEDYDFARFAVKADINDTFSVGVLYDEPWGAAVQYRGVNNFVSAGADETISALTSGAAANMTVAQAGLAAAQNGIVQLQTAIAQTAAAGGDTTALQAQLASTVAQAKSLGSAINVANASEINKGEGTNVEIRTQNATLLLGAKLGQNKNFQVYGGPQMQRLTGEVHLRGVAYGGLNGYDARIGADMGYGWVAGVAYHKPEIALKAALTYRSDIDHERSIAETVPATGYENSRTDFKVTLPESWNLDFQTGLNQSTLLTAKVRYVPWSKFDITPPQYRDTVQASNPTLYPNGLPIISYSDDQWSAEVGVARKLNERLVVQGSVGYDSGAGTPASSLGPIKGYKSVGLGVRYNVTKEWSVSAGAKYLMFGDADAQVPTGANVGSFSDNDGYVFGVKLAYQKK